MGFRFRKRVGPKGLKLNFSKNGLSSISIGGAPFTINVPVNRRGGTRTTVSLPGTGLSWSEESRSTSPRGWDYIEPGIPKRAARKQLNRPLFADNDPTVSELVRRGDDLLEELKTTPRSEAIAKVQAVGDYFTLRLESEGIDDDDPRSKFVVRYWAWLNEEAEDLLNPGVPRENVPGHRWGAKPEQPMPVWPFAALVGLIGLVAGNAAFLAYQNSPDVLLRRCNNGGSHEICDRVTLTGEITNKGYLQAVAAKQAKAKAEFEARYAKQQREAKAKAEREAEYQRALERRRQGGNAMRAAGYWLGPRGGCLTWTSGGKKKYVSRSICEGFFR